MIIHLRPPLPAAFARGRATYPDASRGQRSSGVRGPDPRTGPFLVLLRVGFAEPPQSPGVLVVSYTAVSPLPPSPAAVCSLWHFPAGHPGWALPTTLPCGVRTFLSFRRDHPADSSALMVVPRADPGIPRAGGQPPTGRRGAADSRQYGRPRPGWRRTTPRGLDEAILIKASLGSHQRLVEY